MGLKAAPAGLKGQVSIWAGWRSGCILDRPMESAAAGNMTGGPARDVPFRPIISGNATRGAKTNGKAEVIDLTCDYVRT